MSVVPIGSQDPLSKFDKLSILALAVTSFVISIIMYIMGAKGRLFSATMIVNIVTFALNVLLLALAIALIFAAIRFLESGDFSIFG